MTGTLVTQTVFNGKPNTQTKTGWASAPRLAMTRYNGIIEERTLAMKRGLRHSVAGEPPIHSSRSASHAAASQGFDRPGYLQGM